MKQKIKISKEDKQKAKEIANNVYIDWNDSALATGAEYGAMKMAEYKDDYYYKVITEIVGAAYNTCEDPAEIDTVLKKYNL